MQKITSLHFQHSRDIVPMPHTNTLQQLSSLPLDVHEQLPLCIFSGPTWNDIMFVKPTAPAWLWHLRMFRWNQIWSVRNWTHPAVPTRKAKHMLVYIARVVRGIYPRTFLSNPTEIICYFNCLKLERNRKINDFISWKSFPRRRLCSWVALYTIQHNVLHWELLLRLWFPSLLFNVWKMFWNPSN